jgi:hypothetical protein
MGRQSAPDVSIVVHVDVAGHAPAVAASAAAASVADVPLSTLLAVHAWKQRPTSPGFGSVKPARVDPFVATMLVCKKPSQTKPEGHAAVGPVTHAGAQTPPVTPPSGKLPMKQGQAPEVLSASVHAAPGALLAVTILVTQLPVSVWHEVPVGQSASLTHAERHTPKAPATSPAWSTPTASWAHALPAEQPCGALPSISSWHCGRQRSSPCPIARQAPGDVGASGPSQKCSCPSVPGSHVVRTQTGVGNRTPLDRDELQILTPAPPAGWQSASDVHGWPTVPSYWPPPVELPVSGVVTLVDEASPRCRIPASDVSFVADELEPLRSLLLLLEHPLPRAIPPTNSAPNATIDRGWKCLRTIGSCLPRNEKEF